MRELAAYQRLRRSRLKLATCFTAFSSPSVLVSPTGEYGKIAVALNGIRLHGDADIVTGINVAQVGRCLGI